MYLHTHVYYTTLHLHVVEFWTNAFKTQLVTFTISSRSTAHQLNEVVAVILVVNQSPSLAREAGLDGVFVLDCDAAFLKAKSTGVSPSTIQFEYNMPPKQMHHSLITKDTLLVLSGTTHMIMATNSLSFKVSNKRQVILVTACCALHSFLNKG